MSDNTAKIEVHFDVETQIQMKILIGLFKKIIIKFSLMFRISWQKH